MPTATLVVNDDGSLTITIGVGVDELPTPNSIVAQLQTLADSLTTTQQQLSLSMASVNASQSAAAVSAAASTVGTTSG